MSDLVNDLVEEGLAEVFWVNGEQRVKFDMGKLEILHPELAEEVRALSIEELDETLVDLYNKGLMEMDYRINGDGTMDTIWSITELGRAVAESMGGEFLT